MDDSDEKQLYEVQELQEYQEKTGSFKQKEPIGGTTARQHLWRALSPIFFFLIVITLILVVIMQGVTIHFVINNTPEATDDDDGGTASPITGDVTCNCECKEVLDQINLLQDATQDIAASSDLQSVYIKNISDILGNTQAVTQVAAQSLFEIITTLTGMKETAITTEGVVNDILMVANSLLKLQNVSETVEEPMSCSDIKKSQPDSPSGYYHINSQIVYCEMGTLCNSTEGGWTRLGYFDMSDATTDCPSGFVLIESGGKRGCRRPDGGASCSSLKFPSNGIRYSEVCGRVTAYQYGSTDGVDTRFIPASVHNDINSYYVDGVSITYGYPRNHIWTLMAGLSGSIYTVANCPCNEPPGGTQDVQSFVGNDYFCESGNPGYWSYKLYVDDPVWDGQGCDSQEGKCCSAPGLPWFYKMIDSTTDYLELRLCGDQGPNDEDVPINYYELYVK